MTLVLKIVLGIFGLSFLVLIHELGHYFAAILMGIEVETFSLGFGKKLISIKRKKTEFCLSLIPLGGYCKMKGEKQLMVAIEEDKENIPFEEKSYYSAKPIKRIFVAIAGPLFNFIFAIIAFFIVGMINSPDEFNTTSEIKLLSNYRQELFPADEAGLQDGDKIIRIDDVEIGAFEDLFKQIALYGNETVQITWLRGTETMTSEITPLLNKDNGSYYIGVVQNQTTTIYNVLENSIASNNGVKAGDRILSINGINTNIVFDLGLAYDSELLEQTVVFGNETSQKTVQIPTSEINNMGIEFEYWLKESPHLGFFGSITYAVNRTIDTFQLTVKGIGLLFKGINLKNNLSGAPRIIYYTGDIVLAGFSNGIAEGFEITFEFLAFISVALCFMNLLPIAVLDGGQIVLFIVEMVKQKPLKLKTIMRYQTAGTLLMFALLIFATSSDIIFFVEKAIGK